MSPRADLAACLTRPCASRKNSRNGGVFALVTLGEAWHNNHYAYPESASFGLAWWRLDPGYWFIKLFGVCGLASDIKVPSRERIASRRVPKGDRPFEATV